MGSLTQSKKAWEELVAVKRQAQLESLESFAHELNEEPLKDVHASIRASDTVNSLTSGVVTCEDLVKSYIHKSVILKGL